MSEYSLKRLNCILLHDSHFVSGKKKVLFYIIVAYIMEVDSKFS